MTALPRVLAENEQALLAGWLESQKKAGALRSGQLGEAELGENSRRCSQRFAKVLPEADRGHRRAGMGSTRERCWKSVALSRDAGPRRRRRPRLSCSRSRSRCSTCCGGRSATTPERLAHEIWTATAAARQARPLHDRDLPEEPRRDHPAPAAGTARAVDAGGAAVGRRSGAAADRHARQRAHPGRDGEPAASRSSPPAPRSPSSTSPACRPSTRWSRSICSRRWRRPG